jgi:hypothetical protein
MKVTETHFIVHYGSKQTVDRDCRETGALFSEEAAVARALELKSERGKAFITKRDRKGRIIGTFTPAAVKKSVTA